MKLTVKEQNMYKYFKQHQYDFNPNGNMFKYIDTAIKLIERIKNNNVK